MTTTSPYLPTEEELEFLYEYLNAERNIATSVKDTKKYNTIIQLLNLLNYYKENKCPDSELLYLREAFSYTE